MNVLDFQAPFAFHLVIGYWLLTGKSLQLENEIIGRADIPVRAEDPYENIRYSGFIAQDVEASAKSIGYEFSGVDVPQNEKDLYGLRYAEFVVPLVKAAKELALRVEALEKEVAALRKEMNRE